MKALTDKSNVTQENFAERFSEIQNELYRVAFLYVKNSEDARDVVQETAFRCYKNLKTLRQPEYFRTWAVRTAINCSMNMLRKSRRSVPLEDYMVGEAPSPESSAEAAVLLEKLMNRLSPREKSVVLMRFLYGMTLDEIAKELHIPLGSVKSLFYRSIEKLKKESSE